MGQVPNNQASPSNYQPEDVSERERRDSIRQYLMGDLSEQEREQVERRLISQDDYFEELLIAEEELADDFVSGHLPEPDSAKFRQHFLSVPELQQEVMFANALHLHAAEYARRASPRSQVERAPPLLMTFTAFLRRPAVGFSLAAALLVAVCAFVWMAAQNSRLRARVAQLQEQPSATPAPTPQTDLLAQLASERERGEQLTAQLSKEREQRAEAERKLEEARKPPPPRPRPDQTPGPTLVASATLSPGLIRGSGSGLNRIPVPSSSGQVLVRLDLAADNYPTYRATLKMLGGKELLSLSNLRALGDGEGRTVALILPAARLAPGNDYQILLGGKSPTGGYEDVGTYNFRVVK
jgi:hypothetical protein